MLESIHEHIVVLRGHRLMLDADLAMLYGVELRALNQAVKRDFMFKLTRAEAASLRSQPVILERARGKHQKYLPYAFTEHGVAMFSSVLRSERAIAVNIEIMRAFVRLRDSMATHRDLARKLDVLEKRYDAKFRVVFEAIRQLMTPPVKPRRLIGFGRQGREP